MIRIIITHIGVISSEKIAVILRLHTAAAAPAFIANAEIFQPPRLLVPVFCAQARHRRISVKGHILDPFIHFRDRAGTYVSVDICVTAKLAAQFKKFMCAERIVLYHTAPVGVDHPLSFRFITDTVFPVIFVRKAAARPAEHGNTHFFQRIYHITAHTVYVRNFGIFAHINAFVDTSAEMLGKMAVNVFIDLAHFLIRVNKIFFHFLKPFRCLIE